MAFSVSRLSPNRRLWQEPVCWETCTAEYYKWRGNLSSSILLPAFCNFKLNKAVEAIFFFYSFGCLRFEIGHETFFLTQFIRIFFVRCVTSIFLFSVAWKSKFFTWISPGWVALSATLPSQIIGCWLWFDSEQPALRGLSGGPTWPNGFSRPLRTISGDTVFRLNLHCHWFR